MTDRSASDAQIREFHALLSSSTHTIAFTGAGISTESGIPDFRSPGGVWSRVRPIQFQDFLDSEEVRREAWRRRFDNDDGWVGAKPNAGHLVLAEWVKTGRLRTVITQNVDNLHQDSGVPEDRMIELHGNATYARCLRCSRRVELVDLEREFRSTGTVAACRCGGVIKPATISFGQPMPALPMQRAQQETLSCDLFIVLGSSLSVFPAADFPRLAKDHGANLVIVNRDATQMDELADLLIHDGIGTTLAAVAAKSEKE